MRFIAFSTLVTITLVGAAVAHRAPHAQAANQPPVPTIMSPSDGAVFPIGTNIAFSGSVIDAEDGVLCCGHLF